MEIMQQIYKVYLNHGNKKIKILTNNSVSHFEREERKISKIMIIKRN